MSSDVVRVAGGAHRDERRALRLLGVDVNTLTQRDLHALVDEAANSGGPRSSRCIIAHHNLHSIYLFHHDDGMRQFYARARWVHVDGMPIIWMARLLGMRAGRENRLTSLDWIVPLMATCAEHGLRVFLLGARPEVADRAATVFRARVPGLTLGVHHGFFDARAGSAENERVVEAINRFGTDVLLVGMGMPRQEHWIAENVDRLEIRMAWSLGAFMDYFAAAVPTPPRWMGRAGLEWLFRLSCEPRRLWRRYLLEPWFVAGLFAAECSAHALARLGLRPARAPVIPAER